MSINASLEYRLSGGSANADPALSIGNAMSSVSIANAVNGNLFADIGAAEAAAGSTKYRCFYLYNAGATTITGFGLYIGSTTPSTGTKVYIGLGGLNGTETAVANENTAPSGVVFAHPISEGGALKLPDLPAGQHLAIWVRRDVTAGLDGAWSDYCRLIPVGTN